jgi:predicted RNA methylase
VRIDNLTYSNIQTQGARRREWLRQYSPQHLEQSAALMLSALQDRAPAASRSTLVLGAGACTEIPLTDLARASDKVVLADLDLAAMQQGRDELPSSSLRRKVRLLQCDLTGGVSASLQRLIARQPWPQLAAQGARAIFDAAADCLEECPVPDPPEIEGLHNGEFGLVISSLVLSQLFSYPLLDLLDAIQRVAPAMLSEQERHHRYQQAAQSFRTRVIQAHLNLLHSLVDGGGLVVLLSDVRGFAFNVYGTDHDSRHRRSIPLVPRAFFDLVPEHFTINEEAHWEWLSDLPQNEKLGRGYEVVGYILSPKEAKE